MQTRTLTFDNGRGHKLAARLDLPAGRPRGQALFAHCFTCSKNLHASTAVSRALADVGYSVLRFDFTGLGSSEGQFADTQFSTNVEDLVAAGRMLERDHQAPQLLVGHSLGGAAVLRAAASLPSVRAVATIAAPAHPGHVERLLVGAREQIESQGRAEVELAGRRFTITKRFLEDLGAHPMREAIAGLGRALLVMHAPLDDTVGIDNATQIFTAARHPKSFVSLDGADHLLGDRRDAVFAGTTIGNWAARYLDPTPVDLDAPAPAQGEEVVVRGPTSGFRTEIDATGHPLVADEPKAMGGTNTGTGPYGLLLAGLGACTAMTLRMYADRKGWPLTRADVRLRHDKVHVTDCEGCTEDRPRKLDHIERRLDLHGDALTPQQRARLVEIADRCPVHRTLESEIRIETTLDDE
ncbi:MAG: bifunctional alpha/beta hydrolase/OsmC family protein [Deltaproteobacteria bacterium]|nr:bifunctional alpha/beta hydrolase/OsmC family protein [Deltaproteobacteria bacterium]